MLQSLVEESKHWNYEEVLKGSISDLSHKVSINKIEDEEKQESEVGIGKGIMDSGATTSLTGDRRMLYNIRKCNIQIKCANNQIMIAKEKGSIDLIINGIIISLHDVLYICGRSTDAYINC